jgi:hypothetical protein
MEVVRFLIFLGSLRSPWGDHKKLLKPNKWLQPQLFLLRGVNDGAAISLIPVIFMQACTKPRNRCRSHRR